MKQEEMKARTKQFALRIIRLVQSLPSNLVAEVIGKQLLRTERLSEQITVQLAAQNQLLIL